MTPDIFAEWLCRQGHRIVQTTSSLWVEAGPRIFQAFPYHWVIHPSEAELHSLFFEQWAIGLRYSTTWDAPHGVISYHVVFTEVDYTLSNFHKKARHDVHRGMEAARIEPVSFERLASEGWRLRKDTLQRQGRTGAETQGWWQNLCQSAEGLPGFEAWAAIVNGQMAASLIAFTCENYCSILYQQSLTQFLPFGVNNALVFVFTNEVVNRTEQPWIFYGLHSLDAPPSVDEFKFRMGYRAKPVRQRVVFHPWLRPLFNTASHAVLRGLLRMRPVSSSLAKAEGMVRFYLEGQKPLEQQAWPLPLLQNKEALRF